MWNHFPEVSYAGCRKKKFLEIAGKCPQIPTSFPKSVGSPRIVTMQGQSEAPVVGAILHDLESTLRQITSERLQADRWGTWVFLRRPCLERRK
jgi:hypothetical protein